MEREKSFSVGILKAKFGTSEFIAKAHGHVSWPAPEGAAESIATADRER